MEFLSGPAALLATFMGFSSAAIAAEEDLPAVADAPTSLVPGIAYDEIARLIPPGESPPALGSFDADAAVIAALPPLVLPKETGLDTTAITALALIPHIGGLLAKAAIGVEATAHRAQMNKKRDDFATGVATRQRTGVLAKFAYYRGWSRSELTPAFVTIEKPQQGLTMTLDNNNKTYRSVRSATGIETFTVQSGASAVAQPTLAATPAVVPLAPTQIGGLAARGFRTTGSIHVPRGTFFCAVGEHQVVEVEYVSDVADPGYQASNAASTAEPLVGACTLGSATSHRDFGRLVLYRLITVDPGTPAEFSIVLERGNIHRIAEQDVGLFGPPTGFKEAK